MPLIHIGQCAGLRRERNELWNPFENTRLENRSFRPGHTRRIFARAEAWSDTPGRWKVGGAHPRYEVPEPIHTLTHLHCVLTECRALRFAPIGLYFKRHHIE